MYWGDLPLDELLHACAAGDAEAWEEFVRRFHKIIAVTVYRTAGHHCVPTVELVDDLVQDIYLKILSDLEHILGQFESRRPESIYGYLKVIAANAVHDHFRASRSDKRNPGKNIASLDDNNFPEPADPSAPHLIDQRLLLQEIETALNWILRDSSSADRDRYIFWLRHRQGLTAKAIAELGCHGLSVKGVETLLTRLCRQVRERLAGPRLSQNITKGFQMENPL